MFLNVGYCHIILNLSEYGNLKCDAFNCWFGKNAYLYLILKQK